MVVSSKVAFCSAYGMKARTVSFFQAPLRASCMTLEAPNSTFSEQADDAPLPTPTQHIAPIVCAHSAAKSVHTFVSPVMGLVCSLHFLVSSRTIVSYYSMFRAFFGRDVCHYYHTENVNARASAPTPK